MKKILAMILICTMLFAFTTCAYASEKSAVCQIGGCKLGECFMDTDCDGICGDHDFVDEDKDGICDNHCYLDEDEDGICDHFLDEDGDGICDHCHDHGKAVLSDSKQNSGTSYHHGGHHGRHHSGRKGGRHHGRHC